MRNFFRFSDFIKQWPNLWTALNHYWIVYGGVRAFIGSPYIQISVILTVICLPFWADNITAYEIVLSAVPNLLGFTVGALAIVLAFSSAKIFSVIAEDGKPTSFFMKLTATLLHFILVQVLALIVGTIAKITGSKFLDIITLFLLFYAVLVTFAAGVQLFNTAKIYNAQASLPDNPDDPSG